MMARSVRSSLRFNLPGVGVAWVRARPPVQDAPFPARLEKTEVQ